ncbi:hypothetical protein CUR178_07340 [Leishmania enriettii]|uniref:Uncharacterized protein n=1 Tax=Leishmania enriettii TaxID=5663 RepID=A0A836GZL2_LEIEN|nr:hypothetical protein CUR178_07340 [Leishmania enriettii]
MTDSVEADLVYSNGLFFEKKQAAQFRICREIVGRLKANPQLRDCTTGRGDNFCGKLLAPIVKQRRRAGKLSMLDALAPSNRSGRFCCYSVSGTHLEKQREENLQSLKGIHDVYVDQLRLGGGGAVHDAKVQCASGVSRAHCDAPLFEWTHTITGSTPKRVLCLIFLPSLKGVRCGWCARWVLPPLPSLCAPCPCSVGVVWLRWWCRVPAAWVGSAVGSWVVLPVAGLCGGPLPVPGAAPGSCRRDEGAVGPHALIGKGKAV